MDDVMRQHKFDFKLPLHMNRTLGGDDGLQLHMDGKALTGVTDLTVRAGANGFTNVVIEFDAACAIQFQGGLIAQLKIGNSERDAIALAEVYKDALAEVEEELDHDGSELESDIMGQARMVQRILEMTIERF